MTHSEEIRKIWDEMKELKRLREELVVSGWGEQGRRRSDLENKFEDIEILFGHESSLSKAIIYYLDGSTRI